MPFRLISMRGFGILLFAAMLMVPAWANKFQIYVATLLLIYIILTLGLNLLLGYAGQLAFANAAMFGIGAYGAGLLQKHLGWSFWAAAPIGVVTAMMVGTVLVLPALRLSGIYLALATLAFAQCTIWVMSHWTSVTFGPSGFTVPPVDFSPLPVSADHGIYYLAWICCVVLLLAARNIVRSPIGRAFVALRDNEIAAQSLGINLFRYKALAFALSGLFAGVAGVVYLGLLSFVGPESFGLQQMALQLAAVVIGGSASVSGSVLGGILIVLLQEAVREFKFSIEIVFGALLAAFVLLKPTGLIDLIRLVKPDWREPLHDDESAKVRSAAADGGRKERMT